MTKGYGCLSNRLAVIRIEKSLSQKELAERVGVSRQTIVSLEKNRYNPSLKLAFEIADVLGVDIHEVFQYQKKHCS
ncbi:helix-turn-helix transcriptional regulator [Camelliibacillus cellulosilyticus]|uniref:Helix-turn-helix transcriptional regulator n=1 Tax=Camelliibacillus cellulosilyticus TaxID=2174486 RepID=A0ABV9GRB3_9BACL